jgi:YebC/PmpR family DNA-binding regulatory protein
MQLAAGLAVKEDRAMSGHSKWSKIKHQKGIDDVKKGTLFTKLTREIIMATRNGGADAEGNFRLRLAIQKARDSNMPLDNIDRAIRKGSGDTEGGTIVEMFLEGYGPSGTAILVSAVSDNRNRTVQEVRNTFNRHGGALGESGSVAWVFERTGMITVKPDGMKTDDIELIAIDAGAEDVKTEGEYIEVYTKPEELEIVRRALEAKKVAIDSAELSMIPKTLIKLEDKAAVQALRLMDKLEELDDVQNVYTNADIPDSAMELYNAQG